MSTRWETVPVEDGDMRCYIATSAGRAPAPGVVVCMHAPGVDPFIQDIVGRLGKAGFAAIAPDLYHRDPATDDDPLIRMGRLRDHLILRDLSAATSYLRGLPQVDRKRVGSIGFCMGGRIAYLHAASDPGLGIAVVFYGGNILVSWGDGPSPFERTADIACPVLGLFGQEDKNPSPADVTRIDEELTRLGKPHEFHSYAGAGHAFLNFTRPSYRPEAAADAWEKCLSALLRYLD
jgi:carboxymethylenebutenolidase